MAITPLPTPPTRQDPVNFAERADAFLAALPNFATEVNTTGDQIELAKVAAEAAADAALISENNAALSADVAMDLANFYGDWANLTGPLNVPASVTHSNKVWFLLKNLADVTASEPTEINTDWAEFKTDTAYLSEDQVFLGINTFVAPIVGQTTTQVLRSGDAMTGPLEVPAGATGNQVPRSSEVVHVTGNETIAGVKTFTDRPKVPSGATGDEVPQAQEIYGKSQTEQTVARTPGVTYTNSTGKPIVVTASATSTSADNVLSGYRNNEVVVWSSWPDSGEELNIEFTVFPGATYKLVTFNATDLVVKEYR